jgi:hypothetical protein
MNLSLQKRADLADKRWLRAHSEDEVEAARDAERRAA